MKTQGTIEQYEKYNPQPKNFIAASTMRPPSIENGAHGTENLESLEMRTKTFYKPYIKPCITFLEHRT